MREIFELHNKCRECGEFRTDWATYAICNRDSCDKDYISDRENITKSFKGFKNGFIFSSVLYIIIFGTIVMIIK